MDSKETNPKDAVGIRKAGLQCVSGHVLLALAESFGGLHHVPFEVVFEIGLAMTEGARKYGRHNYRVAGVRASVYYDALSRHLTTWWEGEDIDPDSGVSHVVKALACVAVVLDSEMVGNWEDDRPPQHDKLIRRSTDISTQNTASFFFKEAMHELIIWWEGGLSTHLIDCMHTLTLLREAMLDNRLIDDRPTKEIKGPHYLTRLNQVASDIVDKYPTPKSPFTQKEHGDQNEKND